MHPQWIDLGAAHRVEIDDPTIVEGDHDLEKEVQFAAGHVLVQMHVTDWAEAQREDQVLSTDLDWLEGQKKTYLKALLEEHASIDES